MSDNKAVATRSHQEPFNERELAIIKKTVASKTTPDQFNLFIQVCKYSGLNPFARQIYAVVRGQDMTIQTGIDGYRILAERSGKYAGQIGPEWCDESGEWKEVWLSDKPPVAARIGVLRRDFDKPIWGVARYKSYVQTSSPLWTKMPEVMLAKCAESLALRKAFPSEMAGIYTSEEMAQADTTNVPHASVNVTSIPQDADAEVVHGEIVDASEVRQDERSNVHSVAPVNTPSGNKTPLEKAADKAKERAITSGVIANDVEWNGLLDMVGLTEVKSGADIAKINGKITELERTKVA